MKRVIAFDTETYYHKTQYSVAKLGNYGYTHHESFDPYLLSVYDGEDAWAGEPANFNWDALQGAALVSHNKSFDQAVLHRMVELGLAPDHAIDYEDWFCTSSMSAYLFNVHSLSDAIYLGLGSRVSKQARSDMNGKQWADVDPAQKKGMIDYASGDAIHCWDLWNKFGHLWPEQERLLADHAVYRGNHGFAVDTEKLAEYVALTAEAQDVAEKDLPWTDAGKKPTSPYAIAEECRKVGIPSPPVKTHDADGFADWEAAWSDKFPWVKGVSHYRTVNSIRNILDTIKARLRPDGTVTYGSKYFGAHTGRSSGDAGFNVLNMRKFPLVLDADRRVVDDESENWRTALDEKDAYEKLGYRFIDMRSLIVARPGKILCCADLAQIEPRVLAWLTGNHELLQAISGGMSLYEASARQCGAWTGSGDLKHGDPRLYAMQKSRCLGLGYGCGPDKYRTVAREMAGLELTLDQCKTEVVAFRDENPLITRLWRRLGDTFKDCAARKSNFELELPNGRSLRYKNVRRMIEPKVNKTTGKIEREIRYSAEVGTRLKFFHGGMLAENLTQAVARDLHVEGVIRCEESGLPVLFHVYDEVVVEVDKGADKRDVLKCIEVTPEWLPGCPVSAEATLTPCYIK